MAKILKLNPYKIAIFLSSLSLGLGFLREFLIVGLLGFSQQNDYLQLYLSIFYATSLMIDPIRYACLNLYAAMPLHKIIVAASMVAFPFSLSVGIAMSYSTGGLSLSLLSITLIGSYLNLIVALLITYKQRNDYFLTAQIINVIPNIIYIPGILCCYYFIHHQVISAIIILTSVIPVIQCVLLLLIPTNKVTFTDPFISFWSSILIFVRHFVAMLGEQWFQIISRSAFYHYGTGYLSLFAISVRIYAALRFILVDSFIGSKLAHWKKQFEEDSFLRKGINSLYLSLILLISTLIFSFIPVDSLFVSIFKIGLLLLFGFYFSTLVRIIYFKINRHESDPHLILSYAFFEMLFALFAFVFIQELKSEIFTLLWIGYIAKPFTQLILLRAKLNKLAFSKGEV